MVKLTGGAAQWKLGDWNDLYRDAADIKQEIGHFEGENFGLSPGTGLEVAYKFTPNYSLGVSFELSFGAAEFNSSGLDPPNPDSEILRSYEEIHTDKMIARTFPLFLTFYRHFSSPFSRRLNHHVGLGTGIYISNLTFNSYSYLGIIAKTASDSLIHQNIDEADREGDFSGYGIGFQTVFGTEYILFSKISLMAEVRLRLARVSGYKGEAAITRGDGTSYNGDAELIGGSFDIVPADKVRTHYGRERSRIGFSGVGLHAGICCRF